LLYGEALDRISPCQDRRSVTVYVLAQPPRVERREAVAVACGRDERDTHWSK
jgi:hypothetical protein